MRVHLSLRRRRVQPIVTKWLDDTTLGGRSNITRIEVKSKQFQTILSFLDLRKTEDALES